MNTAAVRPSWDGARLSSLSSTVLLACFVAILSYGASALGAASAASPIAFDTLAWLRTPGVSVAAGPT